MLPKVCASLSSYSFDPDQRTQRPATRSIVRGLRIDRERIYTAERRQYGPVRTGTAMRPILMILSLKGGGRYFKVPKYRMQPPQSALGRTAIFAARYPRDHN